MPLQRNQNIRAGFFVLSQCQLSGEWESVQFLLLTFYGHSLWAGIQLQQTNNRLHTHRFESQTEAKIKIKIFSHGKTKRPEPVARWILIYAIQSRFFLSSHMFCLFFHWTKAVNNSFSLTCCWCDKCFFFHISLEYLMLKEANGMKKAKSVQFVSSWRRRKLKKKKPYIQDKENCVYATSRKTRRLTIFQHKAYSSTHQAITTTTPSPSPFIRFRFIFLLLAYSTLNWLCVQLRLFRFV